MCWKVGLLLALILFCVYGNIVSKEGNKIIEFSQIITGAKDRSVVITNDPVTFSIKVDHTIPLAFHFENEISMDKNVKVHVQLFGNINCSYQYGIYENPNVLLELKDCCYEQAIDGSESVLSMKMWSETVNIKVKMRQRELISALTVEEGEQGIIRDGDEFKTAANNNSKVEKTCIQCKVCDVDDPWSVLNITKYIMDLGGYLNIIHTIYDIIKRIWCNKRNGNAKKENIENGGTANQPQQENVNASSLPPPPLPVSTNPDASATPVAPLNPTPLQASLPKTPTAASAPGTPAAATTPPPLFAPTNPVPPPNAASAAVTASPAPPSSIPQQTPQQLEAPQLPPATSSGYCSYAKTETNTDNLVK